MNNLIAEDIIKKALDESINEFMLEEGLWDSLKDRPIGKLGKSLWNGVKMYMDTRTNGQWNNKYGQYVNGDSKFSEMYYLNKWFNYHLAEIRNVAAGNRSPNRAQQEIEWQERNGKRVGIQKINNYSGVQQYVQRNINKENFNNWVGQYIKDRLALELIDKYIEKCKGIEDVNSAIKMLNLNSFYSDSETGGKYLKLSKEKLNKQRLNYDKANKAAKQDKYNNDVSKQAENLTDIKNAIERMRTWVSELKGQDWYKTAYYNIENNKFFDDNVKEWLLNIIGKYFMEGQDKVVSYITYSNFMAFYGDRYNQDAVSQV